MQAAAKGDLKEVQRLIETKKIDPNVKDKDGIVPLYRAAQGGHLAVVRYLIKAKADPNIKNNSGRVPLHAAAQEGHLAVVQYLIEKANADPHAKNNDGRVPLYTAVQESRLSVVRYLIEKANADPNVKDNDGWAPLHIAIQRGHLGMVRYLIKAKADSNVKDKNGWAPLHFSAYKGDLAAMQYLVETAKADPNIQNTRGETPLDVAAEKEKIDVLRYLINFMKADPKASEKYNLDKMKIPQTNPSYPYLQALSLMIAIEHNDLNNVKKFYTDEIETLCLQKLQYSLLAIAAIKNFVAIVKWLQDQHALQVKNLSSSKNKDQIEKFIEAHSKNIKSLLDSRLYDYALSELNELLKLQSNNPLLLMYESKAYRGQGNNFQAEKILTKIVANPGNDHVAEAYLELGGIYTVEKQYPEAEKAYSKIIELKSNLTPYAYFELGNLEQNLKQDWSKANEHYDEAVNAGEQFAIPNGKKVEIYQQKARNLINLGSAHRAVTKNLEKAREAYNQAMDCYKKILELDSQGDAAIVARTNLRALPQYANVDKYKVDFILGEKLEEPTHYEFAYFSHAVYSNEGGTLPDDGWKIVEKAQECDLAKEGYFGIAYFHKERNILIVSHRGTDTEEWDALVEDMLQNNYYIALNELPKQWEYAEKFFAKVSESYPDAKKFVTGHSLGACLGALTAWKFKVRGVIFDAPGSLEIIQTYLAGPHLIKTSDVPVTVYLSYPDIVNTANHQVGDDIRHVPILLEEIDSTDLDKAIERWIAGKFPKVPEESLFSSVVNPVVNSISASLGSLAQSFVDARVANLLGTDPREFYALTTEVYKNALTQLSRHSMKAIFNAFDVDTGMPFKAFEVVFWPSYANQLVQYEMLLRSCLGDFPEVLTHQQQFKLKHTIGYDVKELNPKALPINQFEPRVVSFLRDYKKTGVAKGIDDQAVLKDIDIQNIEITNERIVIQNQRNIFVLKQYITSKVPPVSKGDCIGGVCNGGVAVATGRRIIESQFHDLPQQVINELDNPSHQNNYPIKFYAEPHKANETSEIKIPFDSGYWDTQILQHPKTGDPIFVYHVCKNGVPVGQAHFFKHPLLCRSEDGKRHNLLKLTGVLQQIQKKIDLATASLEEICTALPPMPPTFFEQVLEDFKQGASKGALNGGWRGLTNVVEYGLLKQNFAAWKAIGIKYTVYYGGIFLTQFYQHYSQQGTEQIGWVPSVYHAAFETMQMGLMQEYLYQFSHVAQKISIKAHNANWNRMGNTLDVASRVMGYGVYGYNVYEQGLIQAMTSIGTGIGAEKLTETVGKKAIDHFLNSHTKALKPKPVAFNKLQQSQETKIEEHREEVKNSGDKSTLNVYKHFTEKHLADDFTDSLNDDAEESDSASDTELENTFLIQRSRP